MAPQRTPTETAQTAAVVKWTEKRNTTAEQLAKDILKHEKTDSASYHAAALVRQEYARYSSSDSEIYHSSSPRASSCEQDGCKYACAFDGRFAQIESRA